MKTNRNRRIPHTETSNLRFLSHPRRHKILHHTNVAIDSYLYSCISTIIDYLRWRWSWLEIGWIQRFQVFYGCKILLYVDNTYSHCLDANRFHFNCQHQPLRLYRNVNKAWALHVYIGKTQRRVYPMPFFYTYAPLRLTNVFMKRVFDRMRVVKPHSANREIKIWYGFKWIKVAIDRFFPFFTLS